MGVHIIMISNRYAHSYEQVLTHTYRQVPTYLGTNMNSHYLGTNTLCLCSLSLSHRHSFNVSLFHYYNTHSLPQNPTISSYLTNHSLSLSLSLNHLPINIHSLSHQRTYIVSLSQSPTYKHIHGLSSYLTKSLSLNHLPTNVGTQSLTLSHTHDID